MIRSLFAIVAAVSILSIASLAPAARTVVAGNGVISGSGTSFTLIVTNTGTETIRCMRYFAPSGTTVPSASGPGTTATFGGGFGAQGLSIAPNQSATFTFTTSGEPLSQTNYHGTLHLSADCIGDVEGNLTGPSNLPCKCISLTARIVPSTIKITNPGERGGIHLEFSVAWFMNCTTGTGGCSGTFEILPPQPAKKLKSRLKPISGRIDCQTDCGRNRSGVAHFTLIAGPGMGNPARNGKAFTMTVKRTCQGVSTKPLLFALVFNGHGLVDKKKSKLK